MCEVNHNLERLYCDDVVEMITGSMTSYGYPPLTVVHGTVIRQSGQSLWVRFSTKRGTILKRRFARKTWRKVGTVKVTANEAGG